MIIFLYGQDTYRSRQKLREVAEHYQRAHKSGLNLKFFEGTKFACQDFKNEFLQTPMFEEKKLAIFKNISQNPEFQKFFLLAPRTFTNSNDLTLFFEEGDISQNEFFEFLIKNAKTQEFSLLEGQKLKNWAKKEFTKYQSEAEANALTMLVNFVGSDLWRLSNEIKKLASYKRKNIITDKDVALLVGPKIETEIFKTINSLAFKNKKRALALIHQHLEKGDHPLYLLAMINYQFRKLLTQKRNSLFTREELKKIYHKLFEADLAVKTGRLDPETALDLFIAEI